MPVKDINVFSKLGTHDKQRHLSDGRAKNIDSHAIKNASLSGLFLYKHHKSLKLH